MSGGETSRIRELVLPFIHPGMCGLDLGYGGDSLSPNTINVDKVKKYTNYNDDPQHLFGDARRLRWFTNEVFDYIYSSHLLEDFPPEETRTVLREWLRVLKPLGLLMLYLPNEKRYRAHCAANDPAQYNQNHQCLEMSLEYMVAIYEELKVHVDLAHDEVDGYSFLIIGRKT